VLTTIDNISRDALLHGDASAFTEWLEVELSSSGGDVCYKPGRLTDSARLLA